jgi:putative phosphoribosyl transferase
MEVDINIPSGVKLKGDLVVPAGATSMVIFAHGSGSSRLSPRNTMVATHLNQGNMGTLLFDLLTETEDEVYETRFDIELLTQRLIDATRWFQTQPGYEGLAVGYFGASTGAAAALNAAAYLRLSVHAVVSRGGRPDMAMDSLARVTAPTLLIVGSLDHEVLQLNYKAYERLDCVKKVEIIEGATHLFEEPGTMDKVIQVAGKWFQAHL